MDLDYIPMYEYEPMDLSKQEIRLLALHPADDPSDPIQCSIQTFDTEADPQYIALSYTWGPVNPQRTILINGRRLAIRQNLYDFLWRYRNDPSNLHYLWIDQICISQAHAGERNHQVRLMARIYSYSLSTIIWLGEKSREAAQRYQKSREKSDAVQLTHNRYFRRLWVVQEIHLSKHKRVLCGNTWIENFFDDLGPSLIAFAQTPWGEWDLKLLGHCISQFSMCECEDPRDKVYGLLGLVSESEKLEVDYSKSKEEVLLQVAMSNVLCSSTYSVEAGLNIISALSSNMGLRIHQRPPTGLFREIYDFWQTGKIMDIRVGFERWGHQDQMYDGDAKTTRHMVVAGRWWIQHSGERYYRDESSYGDFPNYSLMELV